MRELKGFAKVHLKPGKKTISFALDKGPAVSRARRLVCRPEYAVESAGRAGIWASVSVMRNTSRLPFRGLAYREGFCDERTAAVLKPMLDKMEEMFKGGGGEAANEAITPAMISAMIANFPLRALRSFSGAGNEEIEGLLKALNQAASGR